MWLDARAGSTGRAEAGQEEKKVSGEIIKQAAALDATFENPANVDSPEQH